jgi:RNA processing factor Prp31
MPIDVRHIDNGDGFDNTLINHHAKYHEACRLIFNNTKLKRVQKRRCPSEKRSADQSTSSKFTRKTTSVAATEVEPELVQCFICEKCVGRSEIREAMTMQLNDRLNQCAQNLQDKKLLAKLSVGDAVAQALIYHAGCLTALFNRERSALKENRQTMMIHL